MRRNNDVFIGMVVWILWVLVSLAGIIVVVKYG